MYIRALPLDRVVEVHLSGHADHGYLLDTHDAPVASPVWDLYQLTMGLTGGVSTLIDWDSKAPPFDVHMVEAEKALSIKGGGDGS